MRVIDLPPNPRILVVRRDNIGDLLCTTPLLTALRRRFPQGWIGVLANSYNAPVLTGNPDIDAVFSYDKAKHAGGLLGKLGAFGRRLGTIRALRAARPDVAVLAAAGHQESAARFAHLSGARHLIGHAGLPEPQGQHEVEVVYRLAAAFGIDQPPPPMRLVADRARVAGLASAVPPGAGPLVGLHISARKPAQRWSAENFAALAHRLHAEHGARFALFWAPGAEDDARHPGDDGKAARTLELMRDLPVAALPTHDLAGLIAGLSLCDRVVCADGGAMHVAAALGKPLVCLFGNSDAVRWRPWAVPHRLLQADSRDVADLPADTVAAAYADLARTPS